MEILEDIGKKTLYNCTFELKKIFVNIHTHILKKFLEIIKTNEQKHFLDCEYIF